ncbi:MAG: hypothetical protein ACHQRL_09440, partial [Gemmatimonadales bacterium]
VAGIAGGIFVVLAVRVAGWLTGAAGDLCALGGVILTGREDAAGWIAGAVAQLIIAVIAALVYAAIFEHATRRAGALIGLAIGVPHAVLAGLALGFIPVSRLLDAGISPPGAFMEYRGWCVTATFVLAHIAFGTLMGWSYGSTGHGPSASPYRWQDVSAGP